MELHGENIACPYCGEHIDIFIDDSAGDQQWYEDCKVCCRPILMQQTLQPDGTLEFRFRREDESL